MSRTIAQIQKQIITLKDQANDLGALDILIQEEKNTIHPDSDSKVSEWRLWVWVVAVAIWVLEKLFDTHMEEVERRIAETRVHTRAWYREKALAFQYGDTLNESDTYDVIDPDKQIVKFASVRKVILSGRGVLRMKLAKLQGEELAPLALAELDAFRTYINLVADAGTLVIPDSKPADHIRVTADIYYDPQVLDATGTALNDGSKPVEQAFKNYLKAIDFDGLLIMTKLTDALQQAHGVKVPVIKKVEVKTNAGQWQTIYDVAAGVTQEFYNPDAGWLVDDGSTFNYIMYE